MSLPRALLWLFLLGISILIHGLSASRVGREIKLSNAELEAQMRAQANANAHQVVIEVPPQPPKPKEAEQAKLDEPLDFEEEFQLDPPEVLVAPQAVAPPPPNVPLSLKAQAGGAGEASDPVQIAIATPTADVAGLVKRANIPTVGILGPSTTGGTTGGTGGGTAGFGVGIGNALGGSSNQFAAYIQGMRESGLDVMFVVDATGSMGWVIDEVKARIRDLESVIRSLVPVARFGIVAFRDKDGPGFATKTQKLTYSTLKMQAFLSDLKADGGGDIYEDDLDGMKVAIDESDWRLGARKIVILVSDAPISDDQLNSILKLVGRFSSSGGVVSTLDVSDESNPSAVERKVGRKVSRAMYRGESMMTFKMVANKGNGDAATLEGEVSIARRLITLIMGDQFAKELSALLDLI